MEQTAAAENLQVIRTLMERSALYRRALAPIMLTIGGVGTLASVGAIAVPITSLRAFYAWWFAAALVAMTGAFVIARRQAFAEGEAFWSPPTLRVAQAVAPPLVAGGVLSFAMLVVVPDAAQRLFVLANALLYGCAAHAAGFFMPRGMRRFGWLFIAAALAAFCLQPLVAPGASGFVVDHALMGILFGAVHLAYGVYLYATEPRKPTS